MKKNLKIIFIIFAILIGIILLDTLQARLFKNSPLISRKEKLDGDSYVDRGILIDTYYCIKEKDIVTVSWHFKTSKYTCPIFDENNSLKENEPLTQFDLELPHHIAIDDEKYDSSMARTQEEITIKDIKFENIDDQKLKDYEQQYF